MAAPASGRDRVGILWLLYAFYEHQVATGVLCDADCNIRVDLVFFFPILGLATLSAYSRTTGHDAHGEIGYWTRKFCNDGLGEL